MYTLGCFLQCEICYSKEKRNTIAFSHFEHHPTRHIHQGSFKIFFYEMQILKRPNSLSEQKGILMENCFVFASEQQVQFSKFEQRDKCFSHHNEINSVSREACRIAQQNFILQILFVQPEKLMLPSFHHQERK